MVVEFAKHASLLLSLCLLYSFIAQRWPRGELAGRILSGFLFGAICVIGMESPVKVSPGVIFDARSVVLSLSGVIGGPIVAGIAGVISGGYRAYLGGGGAPVGVSVVIACVALGIAFHYAHKRNLVPLNLVTLLLFGLVVHLVELGLFTQLPPAVVDKVFDTVAIPIVVTFAPATAVLGLIFRAIDERIRTREALAHSEARMKAIVDNAPNALTLKDAKGRILLANPAYADWVGSTPEAVVGKTMWDVFPEADARAIVEKDKSVMTSGKVSIEEVTRTFPAVGLKRLRNHKIPIYLRSDEGAALVTIMVDITHEKEVQEELRDALILAEEANQAKTQFLATMSHELRTPLNAIIGFSDILHQQSFGPAGESKYREYAKDINSSASYLLSLVEDLLDVSAIEAGAAIFEPSELDLRIIAGECVDSARDRAYEKDISITTDLPESLPPALADERAMKQVFFNLLLNAIKFTPAGGQIDISAREDGSQIAVSVSDTGPGIEPEMARRLLEPFAKGNHNPFTTDKGWGLGLSISKSLIEMHGGDIWIDSTAGNGTTVHFTVPAAVRQKAQTG